MKYIVWHVHKTRRGRQINDCSDITGTTRFPLSLLQMFFIGTQWFSLSPMDTFAGCGLQPPCASRVIFHHICLLVSLTGKVMYASLRYLLYHVTWYRVRLILHSSTWTHGCALEVSYVSEAITKKQLASLMFLQEEYIFLDLSFKSKSPNILSLAHAFHKFLKHQINLRAYYQWPWV